MTSTRKWPGGVRPVAAQHEERRARGDGRDAPAAAALRGHAPAGAPGGHSDARAELHAALLAPAPFIPSKYFYDPLGSRLFEAITRLPEYYLTRVEAGIFSRHAQQIGRIAGRGATLIDLGAGNCEKAKRLFGVLQPAQYVAVDLSTEYLREALNSMQCLFPGMEMLALALDLSARFSLPDAVRARKRLFFYPGSSIGNFTPEQADAFLARVRSQCDEDGAILISVDLVKDKAVLDAAYDDALGVTAAFNLHVLDHVNALLGSDFDARDWRHVAFFNEPASRVEMHLEARRGVPVTWPGGARDFERGGRIHTENSYKYRLRDFEAMLKRAGFRDVIAWTDEQRWYAVCYARA